ncbi:LexA family protein [Eremococcus coleocola]|uniref:Putative LexA repressor n=1 Tax=Eremococcus coleocola ACS-139-V-Col8 TaxID=908337 RepID=E4KQL0_9LACT|nr:XRE family transcriptional regulator [Eremococcus coleocola]EFR30700.1 putative LexA repressor [Eremococcus coleocola ACS-139-V-Col8]
MNENNFFGKNLKYLRNKKGITQQEIADLIGRKSTGSVSDWEAGRTTPNAGNISKIASYFGLKIDAMVEYDLQTQASAPSNLIPIKQTKLIPVIGRIACGAPILADQNIIDSIAFPVELLPSGEIFFLECRGDSMMPTIQDKALVMVRKQENVEDGEIAVVLLNGDEEATLKRIKRQGDLIMLLPDNTNHPPIVIQPTDTIRIVGKAIKTINNL